MIGQRVYSPISYHQYPLDILQPNPCKILSRGFNPTKQSLLSVVPHHAVRHHTGFVSPSANLSCLARLYHIIHWLTHPVRRRTWRRVSCPFGQVVYRNLRAFTTTFDCRLPQSIEPDVRRNPVTKQPTVGIKPAATASIWHLLNQLSYAHPDAQVWSIIHRLGRFLLLRWANLLFTGPEERAGSYRIVGFNMRPLVFCMNFGGSIEYLPGKS